MLEAAWIESRWPLQWMNGSGVATARPALLSAVVLFISIGKPSEAARGIEDLPDWLVQPAPRPGERPALGRRTD